MEEIWKDVVGENGYLISNLGRIKSFKTKNEKILNGSIDSYGYPRVTLNGKVYSIHRLVATAFIKNTYNKPTVNHKNMIKTDNKVDNLEWMTIAEQNRHKVGIPNWEIFKKAIQIQINKMVTF